MTELEMTSLLLKLADLGVTGIKVKYDGGGDSGAIEWIGYTTEKCDTPEDVNDNIDDWENDSFEEDRRFSNWINHGSVFYDGMINWFRK